MNAYHRIVIFVTLAITVYPLVVSADYLVVPCNVTSTICPMAHHCTAVAGENNDQGECWPCGGGYYCPGGTAMIMCPRGHMCPGGSSPTAAPIRCPDNTMATQDSVSCSTCPTPFFTNNATWSRCDEITGLTIGLIVVISILVLAALVFSVRRYWRRKQVVDNLARGVQNSEESQVDASVSYQSA